MNNNPSLYPPAIQLSYHEMVSFRTLRTQRHSFVNPRDNRVKHTYPRDSTMDWMTSSGVRSLVSDIWRSRDKLL